MHHSIKYLVNKSNWNLILVQNGYDFRDWFLNIDATNHAYPLLL